jgi:hypothetical protein
MFDLVTGALIFLACYGIIHLIGNGDPVTSEMDGCSRFAMQLVMAMGATATGYIIVNLFFHA